MFKPENISQQKDAKIELQEQAAAYLNLPKRRNEGNPDKDLAKKLGSFLIDKRTITKIDMWRGSWGCKYENNIIYINELPMSDEQYKYYIFRLGKDASTGERLFPDNGDETDQYRFLHETSHAYQEYLMNKECPNNPDEWYNNVAKENDFKNISSLGLLFKFCYKKRSENVGRGLSTWGNVPDYNSVTNVASQNALRAIEDANELATMYLWNPQYLDTFLEYVSGNISGYNESNLQEDKLVKLSAEEKDSLKLAVEEYIGEMKEIISGNRVNDKINEREKGV